MAQIADCLPRAVGLSVRVSNLIRHEMSIGLATGNLRPGDQIATYPYIHYSLLHSNQIQNKFVRTELFGFGLCLYWVSNMRKLATRLRHLELV